MGTKSDRNTATSSATPGYQWSSSERPQRASHFSSGICERLTAADQFVQCGLLCAAIMLISQQADVFVNAGIF